MRLGVRQCSSTGAPRFLLIFQIQINRLANESAARCSGFRRELLELHPLLRRQVDVGALHD